MLIKSTNLKQFLKEYGIHETQRVMGYETPQGVYLAVSKKRNIQIIEDDKGFYEVCESKLLNKVRV